MIVIDDVQNWFAATFAADAALPGLIPGGVASERPNEQADQPYGMLGVELAEPIQFNSGFLCYPTYTVNLTIFADTDTAANASAIQARMTAAFPQSPGLPNLRGANELARCMMPQAASAKFAPQRRKASDVVLNAFTWKLMCVGRTDLE